jgi:hypothetical protein
MEKKITDQEENPLSQRATFLVIFFAIIIIVGIFTFVFRLLSFDIPKGSAHSNKIPLIHSSSIH